MSARTKSSEPPETDLDYYARPENYTGSNLNTLTRFLVAKDKEVSKKNKQSKKKSKRSDERELYKRYRHILPPDLYGSPSSSESNSDSENEKENVAELVSDKNGRSSTHYDQGAKKDQTQQTSKEKAESTDNDSAVRVKMILNNEDVVDTNSDSGYESRLRSESEQFGDSTGTMLDSEQSFADKEGRDRSRDRKQGKNKDNASATTFAGSSENNTNLFSLSHMMLGTEAQRAGERGGEEEGGGGEGRGGGGGGGGTISEPDSRSSTVTTPTRTPLLSRRVNLAKFISVKTKLSSLAREARQTVHRQRFQRLIVGVNAVLKLAKAIIKPTDSPSALLKTFTAAATLDQPKPDDQSENMKNYGLHFDPSYYKANKEISISNEVKSFLRLPPAQRSTEQIQTAMFGLQSLPSFAEYPLHMQEKLTRVAWFEVVTPKRTIIRQGHFAENFYFILSGQALVTIHKPGEVSSQTAGMMRKGTSFGELALLHHSRRTATVTSHDTVQLLSIGRDDFFDIFMSGHGTDQMPEHIRFISQMDFMKDWPLERLLERPDQCLLHFFKRNMVILKDSKDSEWFYIVKSGSCQVLKQLKGVTGHLGPLRQQFLPSQSLMGHLQSGASFQESRIDDGRTRQRRKLRTPLFDPDRFVQQREARERREILSDSAGETSESERDVYRDGNDFQGKAFSKLRYARKPSTGTPHFGRRSSRHSPSSHMAQSPRRQRSRRHLESTPVPDPDNPLLQETQPVFVQVEILKPKDVFGLDLVNFNNSIESRSSSVSLVSLGAECIMLSKSFFIRHANDRVKKHFTDMVQPYPDEGTLQSSLQGKADWELYKKSLLGKLTSPKPTGLRGQPLTARW